MILDVSYGDGSAEGLLASMSLIMGIAGVISLISIVAQWKLFKKAGKSGWLSIIPIVNIFVLMDIAKIPKWKFILLFVPIAQIYIMFKLYIELAHQFGKSTGFGVGMVFLPIIFLPMLAFGSATYLGSVADAPMMNYTYSVSSTPNPSSMGGMQPMNNGMAPMMAQQPMNQGMQPMNNGMAPMMGQQPMNQGMQPMNNGMAPMMAQQPMNQGMQPMNNGMAPMMGQQPMNQGMQPMGYGQVPQQNYAPVAPPGKKICPACGNQVAQDAPTCFLCGHKFSSLETNNSSI